MSPSSLAASTEEQQMAVLTLEILGRPVACVCADDRTAAEQMVRQPWFHRDLLSHCSSGAPLWDGSAELSLRKSTAGELKIVEDHYREHHVDRQRERPAVVFLVPVESREDGADSLDSEDYPI
jgi:hypothetical protein